MCDLKMAEKKDVKRNVKIKSSDLIGKKVSIGQITFISIKTYHMLKRDGVEVSMFFDRDCRLQHKKYNDTPIFPWANFFDVYVILTIPERYDELKTMLVQSCGYSEDKILLLEDILFDCSELEVRQEYDWTWLIENTGNASDAYIYFKHSTFQKRYGSNCNLIAPLMAIDVNNRCTLNCKYCYAQMPYYQLEEKEDYDVDEIIEIFDQLLNEVDYIPYLWILGGEPLLHPELHKLISFINSEKVQGKVVFADILTNGTLLFSSEVIKEIQKNPLFWRISASPYGVHSKKQYELFAQLNEAGIPYYSRYMVYWQDFAQVVEPKEINEEYIQRKCEHCICRNLHLIKGKLYRCPVLGHFEELHRIPHDERNFLDCTKPYTKDDLKNYFEHYSPGMAYCRGNHQTYLQSENEMDEYGGNMVPVAEQAKGILPCKRYE